MSESELSYNFFLMKKDRSGCQDGQETRDMMIFRRDRYQSFSLSYRDDRLTLKGRAKASVYIHLILFCCVVNWTNRYDMYWRLMKNIFDICQITGCFHSYLRHTDSIAPFLALFDLPLFVLVCPVRKHYGRWPLS